MKEVTIMASTVKTRPNVPYSADFSQLPPAKRPIINGSVLHYSTSSDKSFTLPNGDNED